ncbi:MAG: metallophosphoesterase family protein [Rubripirellula sp.]
MSAESFRFIHASDFHLERPMADLDELPEHLREAMVQAPRDAVTSIFDAAISERVDFVVLSGDLLQPQIAGPYGLSLLLDGFERLREEGKQVFWSTGIADDHTLWPDSIPIPENVTIFPKSQTQVISVLRAGQPICQMVGRSCEGKPRLNVLDFKVDSSDLFKVGVGYGEVTAEALSTEVFHYWALGGRHQQSVFRHDDGWVASYPGTSQGRSLDEPGGHGYQLIDVDADSGIRIQNRFVDSFRYVRLVFNEREVADFGGLKNLIGDKIYHLQNEHGDCHLLIAWELQITDPHVLGCIDSCDEILQWAQHEYGSGKPSAWSLSFSIKPPQDYPQSWCEEDTILGDFLRVSEKFQEAELGATNLLPLVEESTSISPDIASRLTEVSDANWSDTLQRATRMGVELLRGGTSDGRQHG